MYHEHKKEMILETAALILEAGLRPFIAGNGEYGFYTNAEGSRLVSFQIIFGCLEYSGNYQSPGNGTGWGIPGGGTFPAMLKAVPTVNLNGQGFRYTTLEEHLKAYQSSSKYTEVQPGLKI